MNAGLWIAGACLMRVAGGAALIVGMSAALLGLVLLVLMALGAALFVESGDLWQDVAGATAGGALLALTGWMAGKRATAAMRAWRADATTRDRGFGVLTPGGESHHP